MDKSRFTEIFKMSSSMKGIIVLGLFLFGAGLLTSIVLPLFDRRIVKILWIWVPVIIGYFFLLSLFFKAWKQRNNYIATSDDGVFLCSPDSQIEFIKWDDIDHFKENNIFERLTIIDRCNKQIRVEYELQNLNRFLNILIDNISHLKAKYSSLKAFHKTMHHHSFYIAFIVLLIPLTVYTINSNLYLPFLFLACLSIYFIYLAIAESLKIEIKGQRIFIIYPFWKKVIEISKLEKVTIENLRVGGGKASQCVFLKLIGGKQVKLNAIKEGTIPLYLSISDELSKKSS